MATPVIQVDAFTAGQAAIGSPLAVSTPIVLTDVTPGAAPLSRAWSIVGRPAPVDPDPTLDTPTTSVSGFTPTLDGFYIVRLERVSSGGVIEAALIAIGVPNADGLIFPSAGLTGKMINPGATPVDQAAAQKAGWVGSEQTNTNVLLEAIFRYMYGLLGFQFSFIDDSDSPYDASWGEFVDVTTNGSPVNVRLPTAVGNKSKGVTVRKHGAGTVTVTPAGGQTIDGSATKLITVDHDTRCFLSTGATVVATPWIP